jgi:hypothetical protein
MQMNLSPHSSSSVPNEVTALLNALRLDRPAYDGLRVIDDARWDSLLRFSDLAHLTLPLAMQHISGLPDWVSKRLAKNLADNTVRFERVKSTYLEIANALEEAGVDHIVIKGFTLAPDYVESPHLRQQSDLDIYCRPEDIVRAQAALKSIGYQSDQRLNYSQADHVPTLLRLGDWKWRGNAFDPDMPLSAELHFCLWNEKVSLLTMPDIELFWNRREYRWIEEMKTPTLCTIDQLGYLTLHILRNLLGRDTVIHHVYELSRFLNKRQEDVEFWESWTNQTTASLKSKEVIAFELARQWFGCPLPKAGQREIALLPKPQRMWLQYFGRSALEGLFIENKDAFWLHWSLLSSSRQRLRLLRRTFIPNRIPNPDLPAIVLNHRKVVDPTTNRYIKFCFYIARRALSYSGTHLRTLYRGALWLLQRELSS